MRIPKLALLLAMFLPFTAEAAMVEGFTDCEVKQAAAYWGVSPKKGAKRVKKALKTGDKSFWADFGNAKYTPADCRFADTGLTTQDAEVLAQYWGFGADVAGAKGFVEQKAAMGAMDMVWMALSDASYAGKKYDESYVDPDQDALTAFWSSTYHYCDARLLADFWGIDAYSGKITIGNKLKWGDAEELAYLQGQLAQGRTIAQQRGTSCQFYELNYTYDDAAMMAQLWRTDVSTAKTRMSDLVARGRDGEIRQQLGIARQGQ
jgi:hypothetical protein